MIFTRSKVAFHMWQERSLHPAVPGNDHFAKQRRNVQSSRQLYGSGRAGQANYSASKAGMIALAKSIAQELGSRGIRANAIAPGFIMTAMTDALSEEVKAEWCKKIPLRRGGTPEDVANIATFLARCLLP